ncbi:hypothetical protein F5884DRAFT_678314 [Xylogone sp. PMI_703]|nr:hypothetical protein F5884DRAFT_678314 [Xylogone sp. PMI_703]
MPHANYETPEVILQYFAPNQDGSPPDANDLEIQYGAKNLHLAAVTLNDLRSDKDKVTLTEHGLQLINHETAMAYEDFKDPEKIKKQYYPEVAEAIKKTTGAQKVICFNHNVRSEAAPKLDISKHKVDHIGPMRRVHVDVAPRGTFEAVEKRAGEALMSSIRGRWKIINSWKPLKTVQRDPLAIATGPSCPDEDLVELTRYRPDGSLSESRYSVLYDQRHKWYWVPMQKPDEMLLFNQYSDDPNRTTADRVAHCGFTLPGAENKEIRESVEVRALVIY